MGNTHPKSYRLNDLALARLDKYCKLSGLDASEVARAAIAQFIAPALQGLEVVVQDSVQSKKEPAKLDETQAYFKAFWKEVANRLFPNRVVKTIKDHWDELKGLNPTHLGIKYNEYCEAEEIAGRTPCHPNSWIANGGYKNEIKENKQSGPAWDVE